MKLVAVLILVALNLVGLGVALAKHGQPKEGKHSFWVDSLTGAVVITLYYFAGLFDVLFT